MDYGTPNKFFAACRLAAAVSYISLLSYDSVYVNPWNEKYMALGPVPNRSAYIKVDNLLAGLKASGKSNFSDALRNMEWKTGRGVSFVITDGSVEEGLEEGLKYLKWPGIRMFFCVSCFHRKKCQPVLNGAVKPTRQ